MPLAFERNEGQWQGDIAFLGRTRTYSVAIGSKDLRFILPGSGRASRVVLSFQNAATGKPSGITESPFRTNYYLGTDPSRYRTGIKSYSRAGLKGIYPGVDAEFYAAGDEIEHDFLVAPRADAAAILMRLSSGSPGSLNGEGDVVIRGGEGELRLRRPVAYQVQGDGEHESVPAEFVLRADADGAQTLGFRLGTYDHSRMLVIDPVIVYATFVAGTAGSKAGAIATDPSNNVYVAGTTTSAVFNPSPATAPATNCGAAPCGSDVYVAKLASGSNGSTLQWITYIGAQASASTTVTSIVANSSAVFVGGYTNDTGLAAGPSASAPNSTGGYVGFVSGLTPSTGALNNTTLLYLDASAANNNSVEALALDASGNLYAAGALGTSQTSTLAITPTSNAFSAVSAATTPSSGPANSSGNAYVLKLLATGPFGVAGTGYIAQPNFFTYVQHATQISGIAVDGSGRIYLGGQTTGSFGPPGPVSANSGGYDAFDLSFTPAALGTPSMVTAFTWISGTGDDIVAGLTIDGAGNSYLLGNTTSTTLGTTGTIQSSPASVGGTGSGFVALIPAAGTAPTALTYLSGSGSVDTITGGAFANSTLYVSGTTDAPASTGSGNTAFAGITSTTASSTSPFNPQALAYGMDVTTPGSSHGYLASINGALTGVHYVANLGGADSGDSAVGVTLDTAHNAYVAANVALSSAPFTTYNAYQGVSPATAGSSAYVAEIAYAPTTAGIILAVSGSGSPSVDPLRYASPPGTTTVTYTWALGAAAGVAPANVVIEIAPPSDATLTYSSASIFDSTTSLAAVGASCSATGTNVYCLVASWPQQVAGTNDALELVLNAGLAATPTHSTITVTAKVSSAASDYVSVTQTSNVTPAMLTITPASTFAASTVFSTQNASVGASTLATYALTVANGASGDDTGAGTFSLSTPPANFHVAAVTTSVTGGATATTCDTSTAATGCASIDLPPGASLVYTVTGTYLDAAVSAGSASSAASGSFTVAATGLGASVSHSISSNTTVERGVHLVVTGALSAPPGGQTSFNLADTLTYTLTIANNGPSASSGQDTLAVTLPSGFAASGVSGLSCASPYTSCILPVIASGGSITYVIAGSFPDSATNAGVTGTAVSQTFSGTATLNLGYAVESGSVPADYTTSSSATVQRTATLSVTAATLPVPATVCGSGGGSCLYMQNSSDTKDKIPYSFVVRNAGPDTAVNAQITISLPSAPQNPTGTPHPLNAGALVVSAGSPSFGTALTCTYNLPANQIVCSGGNLPVGTSVLTVSGSATIDSGTVPASSKYVATSAGSVAITESAVGAPAITVLGAIEVDRAAHLVTAKNVTLTGSHPASPINLDENPANNAPGADDTLTVTVQVGATALNDVPAGTVVTEQIPPYFKLTQLPPGICTVAGAPVTFTSPAPTRSTAATMTCVLGLVSAGSATGGSSPTFLAGSLSFTYSGKFQDNGISPDVTGSLPTKVPQLMEPLGSASSVTAVAVDPLAPSDATSTAASVVVQRAAHLILRKTRNTSVAAAPASFADVTDPNLDEKTTGTPFGVNDEVEYGIAVGNAGVNTALGVQFTETLPPFFTVVRAYLISGAPVSPDNGANAAPGSLLPTTSLACYGGAAASGAPIGFPFATGAAAQQITCTYGTASSPQLLPVGSSHTGAPDNATSIEFVYQGKFQDNAANPANNADDLGPGMKTSAVTSNLGDASAATTLAVDHGPASDSRSLPIPAYSIQRAAHLVILGTPAELRTDDSPLTSGGAGSPPLIAQAALSANGSPTPIYNCIRYKVLIQNSGPNVSRQPQLTLVPPAGLTVSGSPNLTTATPGLAAPLAATCTYGTSISPVVNGAVVVPLSEQANNTLVLDIDGYFGLNTLAATNAQTGFAPSLTALIDPGVMDSVKTSPFAPITGGTVTVVNTPSNVAPNIPPSSSAGARFLVSPFSGSATRPARLEFGTVAAPGATTLAVTATGPALPSGPSPNPPDNKKVIPLYRTGTAPNFYSLGTSAVPAAGSNPTNVCFTNTTASGAALADNFAKPERVLLWPLAGLPPGTTLNKVPNTTSPYSGDITASVLPSSGSSYVAPGGGAPFQFTSFAAYPAPESQPAQVCGQVNGFAPAVAPLTLAVLEPVNFAPYITAPPGQITLSPGKGVSEVSFTFPTAHDYNDNDPCYVATTTSGTASRSVCDDNPLMLTWIFGGERLIPSVTHEIGPLSLTAALAFETNGTPYEVQAGATLFLQAADQLAVPIYNAANDCDPGVSPPSAPGSYNPVHACGAGNQVDSSKLTETPPQETLFGSAEIGVLTPSPNGGSSGVIILPPAADPTLPTTTVSAAYTMASATVTAGQTVAFQWKLLDIIPPAGGSYNLSSYMVDASLNTPAPTPAGLACQVQPTITFPPGPNAANSPPNPTIFVITSGASTAKNVVPRWGVGAGGVFAALLLPWFAVRRRARRIPLVLVLLFAGATAGLVGCGSGPGSSSTPGLAPGTYTFRVSATTAGGTTLTTAPFQVTVVAGN